jgi:hypothetical protein
MKARVRKITGLWRNTMRMGCNRGDSMCRKEHYQDWQCESCGCWEDLDKIEEEARKEAEWKEKKLQERLEIIEKIRQLPYLFTYEEKALNVLEAYFRADEVMFDRFFFHLNIYLKAQKPETWEVGGDFYPMHAVKNEVLPILWKWVKVVSEGKLKLEFQEYKSYETYLREATFYKLIFKSGSG